MILGLIDNRANIDSQDLFEQIPLYFGAINGNVKIIKSLIQNSADVNKKDITKSNPLYKATKNDNMEAVEYLMNNEARVKASRNVNELLYILLL